MKKIKIKEKYPFFARYADDAIDNVFNKKKKGRFKSEQKFLNNDFREQDQKEELEN